MKDWIVFIGIALLYMAICVGAGMGIVYKVFQKALPQIQTDSYIKGVKDCVTFQKASEERDQLQGVTLSDPTAPFK